MIHSARRTAVLLLAVSCLTGAASAQGPFVDVAPCHWAAEAVAGIAGEPQVDEAQARSSAYLAENALTQVFEGLRCGDLAWSATFMEGTPAGTTPQGALSGFGLSDTAVSLAGDEGEVAFSLDATIDGVAYRVEDARAALVFEGGRWRVRYDSLAALGLPVFP